MNSDAVYLHHILDATLRIGIYVSVGQEVFMVSPHWQDAVIRQLEVIGEATKRLTEETRAAHPYIPWRRVAGLRDVLIHDYRFVDLDETWRVVQDDLPKLEVQVERILHELGEPPTA